jgi:hypothetical protein
MAVAATKKKKKTTLSKLTVTIMLLHEVAT